MKRRSWMIGLAALLWPQRRVTAEEALTQLDELPFRRMVAGHRGRILVVDFWATWCSSCREEMPKLIALFRLEKHKDVDLVTVSCDEPEQEAGAVQFVNKQGARAPHYVSAKSDEAFINAINPKWSGALPALFVFDRKGKQVQSFVGETDEKLIEDPVNRL
jgi:thiol-disulfide isomerase/thioredoxin